MHPHVTFCPRQAYEQITVSATPAATHATRPFMMDPPTVNHRNDDCTQQNHFARDAHRYACDPPAADPKP